MDDKVSILIVDDETGMRETLYDILEDMGYHTAIAIDGHEAIQKVKDNAFDVILMDIKMPGMDGVETFKQIKGIQPDAAVVMMTAYAVEDLIKDALREGAYGVLYKPLDMERVISVIDGMREGGLVLVVDDDRDNCEFFKDTLETRGYQVSIAWSGEEAIEIVQENNYDMIFIDMKLPNMSGLETYLAIKEINPQAVTVMMTAHSQEADDLLEEPLGADVHTYLYKPFGIEEVIQLVDGICHRNRQGSGQDASH